MAILSSSLVGFVAGLLARMLVPCDRAAFGFGLFTALRILGAVVGLIGSTVGACIVLFLWGF